jgi:DNA polymerase III epsilon subunit-like protein
VNNLDIVCFDFETGGLEVGYHEVIQVAGKAYNGRTLEPYPVDQGGEFSSLMRPMHPDRLEDAALKVNGKTRKELEKAPSQKDVWCQFIDWVSRYNPKKNAFNAPIPAGKNIRHFDLKFVDVLNETHSPKKKKTVLFNTRTQLDLEDIIFLWFEGSSELSNFKMDTIRTYFGMSHENSHDALTDTRQTGEIIIRFLKLHRELQKRQDAKGKKFIQFQNAFARK